LEAASITAPGIEPTTAARIRAGARAFLDEYGLIILLLAMPVGFGVKDLIDEGSLSHLANNLKDGLSNGAIYAVIALGYTLVYGIVELINFAHGDLFMLGTATAAAVLTSLIGPLGLFLAAVIALLVAMITCAGINAMIERVAYRPLRNAPKLAPLITAVGFSFILVNVGQLWLGGQHVGVGDPIHTSVPFFTIFGVPITHGDVLAFGVTTPLLIVLSVFVTQSRLGKAMRATAQDPEAARLMGINVDTTISVTFLLGGALAGAAGLIWAMYQNDVYFFQGFQAGLIAFTAAVMGGIGNLKGAVLGGLIIGCIQIMCEDRISQGATWSPAIVFLYLILIMVFRPRGLVGEETREAG
jgi:branched-chain amino acid transport system permease protein